MGLFVADDGRYRGWLATLLCCCAAVGEDEHPVERRRLQTPTSTRIVAQQPLPLNTLPSHPYSPSHATSTTTFKDDELILDDDLVRPISKRPSSLLKPLDLGESSLLGRMATSGWARPSTAHAKQPSSERHALVPLKLSPVVLRQPTRPRSFDDGEDSPRSTDSLMDPAKRQSYLATRETPFQRCQHLSAAANSAATSPSPTRTMEPIEEDRPIRPLLSASSSLSSMRSHRKQPSDTTSAISSSTRSSLESKRLKRKRSFQSRRKISGEEFSDPEIDREILELNTIVEERRAEVPRPTSSNEHISAVAPSMAIRARSETLTSIGSAFARPSTAQMPPATAPPQASARLSQPFTNMPAPPPLRPATAQGMVRRPSSRSQNRLSGWLSDLLAARPPTAQPEPFYKCTLPAAPHQQQHQSVDDGRVEAHTTRTGGISC